MNEQNQRIIAVIGNEDVEPDEGMRRWYRHLVERLTLPCGVTGIEDFQWEEFYVIGPGDKMEYQKLCRSRPSYRDTFELTTIELNLDSEWSMFPDELKGRVRRTTDSKLFILGLSELKATKKSSLDYQLLRDYASWLINYR